MKIIMFILIAGALATKLDYNLETKIKVKKDSKNSKMVNVTVDLVINGKEEGGQSVDLTPSDVRKSITFEIQNIEQKTNVELMKSKTNYFCATFILYEYFTAKMRRKEFTHSSIKKRLSHCVKLDLNKRKVKEFETEIVAQKLITDDILTSFTVSPDLSVNVVDKPDFVSTTKNYTAGKNVNNFISNFNISDKELIDAVADGVKIYYLTVEGAPDSLLEDYYARLLV